MLKKTRNLTSLVVPAGAALFVACENSPTTPVVDSPSAPVNLVAQAADDQRIDLSWVNAGDASSGYVVERRTGQAGGFDEIAQLNSESRTSYADVDLSAEAEYCYRVSALGSGGMSGYSNVACGTTLDPGALAPAPVDDPYIPSWPESKGPYPTTTAISDPGEAVQLATSIPAPNAIALGTYSMLVNCQIDLSLDNGNADAAYAECRDRDFYGRLKAFRDSLGASGGTSTDCLARVAATPRGSGGEELPNDSQFRTSYDWSTYCFTFHNLTVEDPIGLRHNRIWRNVTSRLLGPGTSYSITYRWSEGVETSNGFEYTTTTSQTAMTEENWNNCVGGSAKVGAEGQLGPVKLSAEVTVSGEDCFGGKSAQETSTSLTNTLSGSHTISSERGGEETTSVSGVDGANRVYDVWQLVDQYTYIHPDGTRFTADDVKGASYHAIPDRFSTFDQFEGWVRVSTKTTLAHESWLQAGVIWPEPLRQGTTMFAQVTTDWPIGNGSFVAPAAQVRYFELGSGF